MIASVTLAVKLDIGVNNYMLYSWICLPFFIAFIIALSGVSFKSMGISSKKIPLYLSEATYCLFLAKLFSNKISKVIIHQYHISRNFVIIFVGWSICIAITVFLHEVMEKWLKRHFKRLLLEWINYETKKS